MADCAFAGEGVPDSAPALRPPDLEYYSESILISKQLAI